MVIHPDSFSDHQAHQLRSSSSLNMGLLRVTLWSLATVTQGLIESSPGMRGNGARGLGAAARASAPPSFAVSYGQQGTVPERLRARERVGGTHLVLCLTLALAYQGFFPWSLGPWPLDALGLEVPTPGENHRSGIGSRWARDPSHHPRHPPPSDSDRILSCLALSCLFVGRCLSPSSSSSL